MPTNKLILRSTASPYVFPYPDAVRGSVLSWSDVDNNFIFLKGLNIQNGSYNGEVLTLTRVNGDSINITGITSAPAGTNILDFGIGNSVAEIIVTGIMQARTTSIVTSTMRLEATPEHSVDDLQVDPIRVSTKDLIDGVGFTIYGATDNAPANGTYKVDWNLTN